MRRVVPLPLAGNGALVRVIGVDCGAGLASKLAELGIYPGAILRVIASRRGPVIIEFLNSSNPHSNRLMIGFGIAMKILVEVM